jgi:hypothetical protein
MRSNDRNLWMGPRPGGVKDRTFGEDDLQVIWILIRTGVGALVLRRYADAYGSQ